MLRIDVERQLVRLSSGKHSVTLSGQWVEFYAHLAANAGAGRTYVTAEDLHRFQSWAPKRLASVGKEVSGHLGKLKLSHLDGFIEARGKTKAWRIAVSVDEVCWEPSEEAGRRWLAMRRWHTVPGSRELVEAVPRWAPPTIRAILRCEGGELQRGLRLLNEAKRAAGEELFLKGIVELLEARFGGRLAPEVVYGGDLDEEGGLDAISLRSRLYSTLEVRPGGEPEAGIATLEDQIADLRAGPDLEGLGVTYNALGVLARRSALYSLAEGYLAYAVALLTATLDLPTLQAAVFNLGHCKYLASATPEDRMKALRLIELDREMWRRLHIGGDSAQAEVMAGQIELHLGNLEAAQRWLRRAYSLLRKLGSPYDRACASRLDARIQWHAALARGDAQNTRKTVLDLLIQAEHWFATAGVAVADLEADRAAVRRGESIAFLERRPKGAKPRRED